MNANELADELTELIVAPTPVDDKWACELIDQAATMLRQQQAEIEALKKFNKAILKKGGCDGNICQQYSTHPVKELTDEEIVEMAKRKANQILMDLLMPDVGNEKRIDWNVGCTREHLKNFAKAILRKANEK